MLIGRLRKVILFLVLACSAGVGLLGSTHYYLTSQHATQQIADRLQAYLGVPVQIDKVNVGFQDNSSLKRIQVFEANSQRPNKPWLTIREIRTDLSALDLVSGNASPRRIVLAGAAIELRFGEDGTFLTGLPTIKPASGQAFPHLVLEKCQMTINQEGRTPMVIEGVDAEGDDRDGVLTFHGTIHDNTWGDWMVAGSLQVAEGKMQVTYKSPRIIVTQELLERLPFVSASVWNQVKLHGVTPVEFNLQVCLGGKGTGTRYRIELEPKDTEVTVTSIDLKATQASGRVSVFDSQVLIEGVCGKTADGVLHLRHAALDFRETPNKLTFDLDAKALEPKKLPASWKIPVPNLLTGSKPLTGNAKLVVQIQNGKAEMTGDGTVEAMIFNSKTNIKVLLKADDNGFQFSIP